MIPDKDDIRHFQSVHDVPLPKKLFGQPEVTHISSVNDEIDIISLIDLFYKVFCLIIPSLRIAHRDKTDGCLSFALSFYLFNVMSIYVCLSTDTYIVGVVVYQIASGQKQADQESV